MLKGIIVREEEDLPCVGARTGLDLSVRAEDFEGKFEGWRGFEGKKRFACGGRFALLGGARTGRDLSVRAEDFEGKFEGRMGI